MLDFGAAKYSPNGWLESNGKRTSFKEYHDSMFHHLAMSFAGERIDKESGLDHLLHVITNAQMLYTRLQRNIRNDKDEKPIKKESGYKMNYLAEGIELNDEYSTYLNSEWYNETGTDLFNSLPDTSEKQANYPSLDKRSSDEGMIRKNLFLR